MMSTPKRRRLHEPDALHKPFKTPFRTPPSTVHNSFGSQSSLRQPSDLSKTVTNPTSRRQGVNRHPHPAIDGKDKKAIASLSSQIAQIRQAIDTLNQASSLLLSDKDAKLESLITKWRAASQGAAEELFSTSRDRVNRMGGVNAWRQQEQERYECRGSWDDDYPERQSGKTEVDQGGTHDGDVQSRCGDQHNRFHGSFELGDAAYRKQPPSEEDRNESFTMDMMLKSLHVDLDVIGYSSETQQWIG